MTENVPCAPLSRIVWVSLPDDDDIEVSTCPGCGSYGSFGSVCIRVFDGQREECGVRG